MYTKGNKNFKLLDSTYWCMGGEVNIRQILRMEKVLKQCILFRTESFLAYYAHIIFIL